jgi:hypothetical protein
MPAKKKAAVNKSAKKAVKPEKKKPNPKKKEPPKKDAKKKAAKIEKPQPLISIPIAPPPRPEPEMEIHMGPMKDCDHCDATGKCAAGQPYDKGYNQMFGSKIRLTSCIECLEAAGEHHNSKKLVTCSFCKGSGKVPE